jgi:A/G-specific adenine glycosylase
MELGAIVCTARSPRCEECPLADVCVWRLTGYPDYTGPARTVQKSYEGSDRQARGRVLEALRESAFVQEETLVDLLADASTAPRILDGLIRDGLAVREGRTLRLP